MSSEGIIGAFPPPEGVTPNFTNPESIAYRLIIVAVVFPVLSLCFLIPRLYTANFILRRWHADDYWIIAAFIIAVANSIICCIQLTLGLGRHIWDVPARDFTAFMKLGMIGGAATYNLGALCTKISILSFYLRFSVDTAFRYAVYAVMIVAVGYTLPNAILFTYVCTPMQFYWDWSLQGKCIDIQMAFNAANSFNMITDFAILLLPIWMLWDLRAPLTKKMGVALILMTGGFVCAVSTMRMVTAVIGAYNPDITWHYITNLIWCLVEMYTGIICACLPCLKAFVKRYFPNSFLFSPEFEERLTSSIHISLHAMNPVAATRRRQAEERSWGAAAEEPVVDVPKRKQSFDIENIDAVEGEPSNPAPRRAEKQLSGDTLRDASQGAKEQTAPA
ncbi:hypothetical protein B0H63DRAFT_181798 [Podospora didyma]|uniref:Rhodopsin domain-containing protein n=1 Tax=Podospora didyma TaxID=330526 RepID=A0AAE0TZG7_9PEZI|nr:hypothetical protein B0H63DRAFT_181798 [Podospora didyma]